MKFLPHTVRLVCMRPFIACSVVASLALSHAAYGVEADSVRILAPASATCPAAADVARELSSLMPRLSISAGEDVKPASSVATISIVDADDYRVDVGSESRAFVDGNHRCADRARTAAVFIAMSLSPPDVAPDSETNAAPDVAPPPAQLTLPIPAAQAPHDASWLWAPHLDPVTRASIGVYGGALAGTLIGIGMWVNGATRPSAPTGCLIADPPPSGGSGTYATLCFGSSSSNRVVKDGMITTFASAAFGAVVGIPLSIVGARRTAAKREDVRIRLVPVTSSTQAGLGLVGTF
jgi:hypothetical protein